MKYFHYSLLFCLGFSACAQNEKAEFPVIPQWTTHEIELNAERAYENPYTDVEVWAVFRNEGGDSLVRPAFWDGGQIWKIRFAPPDQNNTWSWQTFASEPNDSGLHGQAGQLRAVAYEGEHALLRHGLLKMSAGKRNVVHHDDRPFLVVGDTPWAIPFRATLDQVKVYAKDRQDKGFNAALLMSVQPDQEAEGPNTRDTPQGFVRGFTDLSDGHINQLVPEYFQYLDTLVQILIDHEIVPVYQPIFHGFGWKGKLVLGNTIVPEEYVRYCKYLLARYGSQPAFWLLAGDNDGKDPGVEESGIMMERWDAYQQPTGLHYNPCDDYVAEWAVGNPLKRCMHYNRSYQAADWLDFQWAQTGHNGDHQYHKVARLYEEKPTKAVANGEPTYEGMGGGQNGLGWWQGEEAWMQLMSGGTMGVFYGAACLWQWKVSADEEGWSEWADQDKSWREAMEMEGATYVGHVRKAFAGMAFADMEKRPDLTSGQQPLLAKPGTFYISYLNSGGSISIDGVPAGLPYRWYNPRTGVFQQEDTTTTPFTAEAPDNNPWVLIIGERRQQ